MKKEGGRLKNLRKQTTFFIGLVQAFWLRLPFFVASVILNVS
jgi:hypothetical protein